MPVLSSTAPEVTPEFEQQERDALSAEDLQKIHDEMYGISSSGDVVVVETEDEMSHSVASQLVQEALETIPDDIHKHAYNEAIQHHPNLVEKESNALTFMRSEGYNAMASAKRIVKYWNERRKLFGKIKAYEPMTIAGAMSEDVDTLQQGLANILPNDIHGRPVWFLDRIGNVGGRGVSSSSIENNSPTNKHEGGGGVQRKSLLKVIFYVLHVLCERNKVAQTQGIIFILNLKGFNPVMNFDRILTKTTFKLMEQCIPTRKMIATHVCIGKSQPAFDMVLPNLKQIGGKAFRLRHVQHSGNDDEDMISGLLPFGIVKEHLPEVVGGCMTQIDCFHSWFDKRLANEEEEEIQEQR